MLVTRIKGEDSFLSRHICDIMSLTVVAILLQHFNCVTSIFIAQNYYILSI